MTWLIIYKIVVASTWKSVVIVKLSINDLRYMSLGIAWKHLRLRFNRGVERLRLNRENWGGFKAIKESVIDQDRHLTLIVNIGVFHFHITMVLLQLVYGLQTIHDGIWLMMRMIMTSKNLITTIHAQAENNQRLFIE